MTRAGQGNQDTVREERWRREGNQARARWDYARLHPQAWWIDRTTTEEQHG